MELAEEAAMAPAMVTAAKGEPGALAAVLLPAVRVAKVAPVARTRMVVAKVAQEVTEVRQQSRLATGATLAMVEIRVQET